MRYLSTKAFLDELDRNKKYCFILGAGASVSSGIPSGSALAKQWLKEIKGTRTEEEYTEEIERRINALSGISDTVDYSRFKNYDYKPDLSSSLMDYSQICKLRFEGDSDREWQYLFGLMKDKIPLFGYWPLASVLTRTESRIVITTNFDELTETAINYFTNDKCNKVTLAEDFAPLDIITDRPRLLKLHKDIETRPYNTEDRLRELDPNWKPILDSILMEYTPIVIGYAGTDTTLTAYLHDEAQGRGIYWCNMFGDLPNASVTEIVEKRDGCIAEIWDFEYIMYKITGKLCDAPLFEKQITGEMFGADNYQGYTWYNYYDTIKQLKRKGVGKEIIKLYLKSYYNRATPISFRALFQTKSANRLRSEGKHFRSLKLYEKAISYEAKRGRYFGKGKLYYAKALLEMGCAKQAETVFRELLDQKTVLSDAGEKYIRNEAAYYFIVSLVYEGKFDEANDFVEGQLNKRKCDGLFYRQAAIIACFRKDYLSALQHIRQAIECHQQNKEYAGKERDQVVRGLIKIRQEDYDMAKIDLSYVASERIERNATQAADQLLAEIYKFSTVKEHDEILYKMLWNV